MEMFDKEYLDKYQEQCYKLINYKKRIRKIESLKDFNANDTKKYNLYDIQKKKVDEGIQIINYILENNLYPENRDEHMKILGILEDKSKPTYFNC